MILVFHADFADIYIYMLILIVQHSSTMSFAQKNRSTCMFFTVELPQKSSWNPMESGIGSCEPTALADPELMLDWSCNVFASASRRLAMKEMLIS